MVVVMDGNGSKADERERDEGSEREYRCDSARASGG
jgi:hypothetical protein